MSDLGETERIHCRGDRKAEKKESGVICVICKQIWHDFLQERTTLEQTDNQNVAEATQR